LRTQLSKDHRQLEKLGDWMRQFATQCGLSNETTFSLDLVLTEAVTNVMDHACGASAEGEIELVCTLHEGYIAIEVLDDGPPFDPTAHAPAPLPKTLEDVRPGGLGIHLMREYTSYMHYRRENDRNILCMTLPIQPAPPSD
jgi:anti-sigma regulatory factor (Ser/Thr protein kinase)